MKRGKEVGEWKASPALVATKHFSLGGCAKQEMLDLHVNFVMAPLSISDSFCTQLNLPWAGTFWIGTCRLHDKVHFAMLCL